MHLGTFTPVRLGGGGGEEGRVYNVPQRYTCTRTPDLLDSRVAGNSFATTTTTTLPPRVAASPVERVGGNNEPGYRVGVEGRGVGKMNVRGKRRGRTGEESAAKENG